MEGLVNGECIRFYLLFFYKILNIFLVILFLVFFIFENGFCYIIIVFWDIFLFSVK